MGCPFGYCGETDNWGISVGLPFRESWGRLWQQVVCRGGVQGGILSMGGSDLMSPLFLQAGSSTWYVFFFCLWGAWSSLGGSSDQFGCAYFSLAGGQFTFMCFLLSVGSKGFSSAALLDGNGDDILLPLFACG